MAAQDLSSETIQSLIGTRHPVAGLEFPPRGLQPYYEWLIRALAHLADASFGALRVAPDDQGPLFVRIAPGRATINGVVAALDTPATLDLSALNNQTAYVWLTENAGVAVPLSGPSSAGWPATPHLKLAEFTLSAGGITQSIDRRLETVFQA
ncbi:MAG: hypothetical protein AAGA57_04045 [Planctomycetota bacterium]